MSQFYFGDDGVPTYGDTVPDVTPLTGVQRDGNKLPAFLPLAITTTQMPTRTLTLMRTLTTTKKALLGFFADIIRAQTQDYLIRFAPIEDYLASTITRTGTTFLEGDMERTREAVMGGAQSARDQYTRQFERYGVMGKQLDNTNATTSALVGGMNDTRDRDVDRKIAASWGGTWVHRNEVSAQQGTG